MSILMRIDTFLSGADDDFLILCYNLILDDFYFCFLNIINVFECSSKW